MPSIGRRPLVDFLLSNPAEFVPLSVPLEHACAVPATRNLPWVRWLLLSALLVGEMLAVSLRFDVHVLVEQDLWWVRLIGKSSSVLHWAMAAAAALLVFQGAKLWEELGRLDGLIERSRWWWAFLLAHLAAFAAFFALTFVVLTNDVRSLAHAEAWFAAWGVLGLTTFAFWAAAMLPPHVWPSLSKRLGSAVALGLVVGLLASFAGQLTSSFWKPLRAMTFFVVTALLRLTTSDVVCIPADSVIGTTDFRVSVAPECSGYEGIGLIWVFLGAYLWLFRRELRFPAALLLLPLGTLIIWLANAARIAALVLIGSYGSAAVAREGFHSNAGWLAFNAVGLGLVVLSRRLRFFRAPDNDRPEVLHATNPTAAYLAPLMTLIGMMMVTGAVSAGFDRLYPLRILAAAGVLGVYRREYLDLRWTLSWSALALGVVVFGLWMALEPAADGPSPLAENLSALPRHWATVWLLFRIVGSIVIVPLAEELAFRGYLIRRLIAADFTDVLPGRFTWLSFVLSSVLFGALHGRWLAGTIAGLLFAVALYRRRELTDAVVAHAVANALIAAYVLATGSWSMWS